jgi:hypothetical protein
VGQGAGPERLHAPLRGRAGADDGATTPPAAGSRDYSDLLAYEDPDAGGSEKSADETKKTGQPFYTDAGRIVYAAGGITPDVLVKNNFDSKLVTQLLARNMFFNFAVQWLPKHPEAKGEIPVTPALRQEFFKCVEASNFSSAEELTPSPRSTIKNEIPWWPPSLLVFTAVTMKCARTPLVM